MDLILDTNALSAVVDEQPGITEALGRAATVAIPVIVLGEYRFGIAQSRRRAHCEGWLNASLVAYDVLEVNERTAKSYAEIRVELKTAGKPIPSNDLWIAALCRQHRMTLLSRDRHFDVVDGLRRIVW
ncbi:MAG TPA: type II toxin-antitoxin system VapC family toxin [Bryobacteraceae bacterium]|jgi:tRNA(fMet)-specific endonuclease VapC|nr:type II toxin-antitoxin system VapC family toxin [Bryobacteraceae bacterium]